MAHIKYLQYFAWNLYPIFKEDNKLTTGDISIDYFYKIKDDFQTFVKFNSEKGVRDINTHINIHD